MQVEKQKAKGVSVDGGRRGLRRSLVPFALCLLPVALLSGVWFVRSEAPRPAPAPLGVEEADEVLRRAAQTALGGREGVVLVLDAQTGRVRASAGGRAIFEEATPPGSAIKPFTMLAALRTGTLDADSRRLCRRRYEHEEFKINCSHPRYQTDFGPAEALANSCNYYFGRAAETLDAEAYARTLREFGFGARTAAADVRESAGLLPRDAARVPEMLGESEQLRVTPAQLATAYAALFNGGALLEPRTARAEGFTPAVRAHLEVEPAHRALLLAGMRGAVAYGTAARAGLATLPVYVFGKTGTSTPQGGWRAQGWFVGFAAPGTGAADGLKDVPTGEVQSRRPRPPQALARRRGGRDRAPRLRGLRAHARGGRRTGTFRGYDLQTRQTKKARPTKTRAALCACVCRAATRRCGCRWKTTSSACWPPRAASRPRPKSLKALAVSARTYAVRNLRRHARDRFDLCDTTHCQRFVPVRDESARPDFYELARRAVRETAGEVLRDSSGRVAESYFSAACGGRTADVSKLWGASNAPAHLRGVTDESCAATDGRLDGRDSRGAPFESLAGGRAQRRGRAARRACGSCVATRRGAPN